MARLEEYLDCISELKREAYDRGVFAESVYDNAAWKLLMFVKDDDWEGFVEEVRLIKDRIGLGEVQEERGEDHA